MKLKILKHFSNRQISKIKKLLIKKISDQKKKLKRVTNLKRKRKKKVHMKRMNYNNK